MPEWQEAEDRELVALAQKGNVEAFGVLYERHVQKVHRFLAAHLDNPLDAEDLTSDVFIRAWRSLPFFHDRGVPFPAYLLRIARNAMVDHYRRPSLFSPSSLVDVENVKTQSQTEPVEIVITRIKHQHLRHVLQQLRPDYRTVLALRFLSGLTPEETARVMRRSAGAVRVLQHRALAALRRLLPEDE